MTFILEKAVRGKKQILFSICGDFGSGKTFSSLILARGIVGVNGKIIVIDTDVNRAEHYATIEGERESISEGIFDFQKINVSAPFTPERYMEAIQVALDHNPDVIIVDNMTNVWDGDGGILEEVANKDESGLAAWKLPKKRHNKMMNFIIESKCHFVFCVRAKNKKTYIKNHLGKREVVDKGYSPICDTDMMGFMSGFVILHATSPGVVNYEFDKKLNNQLQHIFKDKQIINIEHGVKLKEWADNGCDKPKKSKLEIGYERLSTALSKISNLDDLQHITKNKHTIGLRAELEEKEPQWADVITDLIEQALASFEAQGELANVV